MWRLIERNVRSGLVMAWRLATSPTRTSPDFEKATTDGVVREPSAFGMTTGSPPSRTATTELVVPRSIPTALAMGLVSLIWTVRRERATARLRTRQPHGNPPSRKLERDGLKSV